MVMEGSIHPGQLIDLYKIETLIGQDQFRDHYSAYEVDSGKTVSLSILKKAYASDDLFAQDYLQRTQTLTQIRHPNLTNHLKTGVFNGVLPYVTTEPVGGFHLSERLNRLAEKQDRAHAIYALTLVQQIASGLALTERLEIFHSELTPDHILLKAVTLHGEESVIVADLDLPDQPAGEHYEYSNFATGYLSPEQLSGNTVDSCSHVYSLGVILYELLCGQRPAKPLTRRRKLWSALSGKPALEQLRSDLSPHTVALVEQSLYSSRRLRYASVAEFQKAVDEAIQIEASPKHADVKEPANRPRPVFLIPLLMILVCGVLGLLALWFAPGLGESAASSLAAAAANPTIPASSGVAITPTLSPTASYTPPSPTTQASNSETVNSLENSVPSTISGFTATVRPTISPIPPATSTAQTAETATVLPASTPTPVPTATPEPSFRVLTSSANLRLGPGIVYAPVGFVIQDEELEIVGRSDGDYIWLNVLTENGQRGWVAADVGELSWPPDLTSIEPAATIPPAPTAKYTPVPTVTPLPPTAVPLPASGGGSSGNDSGGSRPRPTPTPPL